MVGQMKEPIVIEAVLSREEYEGLWQYFDRTQPAVNSLATVSYTHLTLPTICSV